MLILIPVDSNKRDSAEISSVLEAKFWALLDIDEGKIQKIDFYDDKEKIDDFMDAVVVNSDFEQVMEFIEAQMMVLVAHTQKNIDDIVEAYLFRELHQLAH